MYTNIIKYIYQYLLYFEADDLNIRQINKPTVESYTKFLK